MTQVPVGPPPPTADPIFDRWVHLLWRRLVQTGQILWNTLDFTGSNLTDIETRNHNDLQNLNSGDYVHLTAANHTDLTDSGDSTLHYHAADRARANHTGTQTLATISDAGTMAGQNANNVAITGGAVDGTPVGGTTRAAGSFTALTLDKTITAAATTGAQTIDKPAGSVNFAAAATSLVVTNSLVNANSVIVATVATNDVTMLSVQAVATSGSFTLYANAAATAETRVNFIVIN